MKKSILTFTFSVISLICFAQTQFTEATFNGMMDRYSKDYASFIQNEVSPESIFIGSTGFTANYEQFKAFTDGAKTITWQFSDIKVRQYDAVAIVNAHWKHSHQNKDKSITPEYIENTTMVFVWIKDKWMMVSSQNSPANIEIANDEKAIKDVIERETATWRAGDAKGHAECWEVRPYSRVFVSLLGGIHIDVKPETMKLNSEAMGGGGSSLNTNYKISVNGNSAWANFDEETTNKDGSKGYSHEMRILEKVNGKWKIVGESVHYYKPSK